MMIGGGGADVIALTIELEQQQRKRLPLLIRVDLNTTLMTLYGVVAELLLTTLSTEPQVTKVRGPYLGACNSHTKPMSRHFYRPVYFEITFSRKNVNLWLNSIL